MPSHVPPTKVGSFPFHNIEFDKSGALVGKWPEIDPTITDVVVVSHGWNNSASEAQELYDELFGHLAQTAATLAAFQTKHLAVIGIFWPSKKFNFAHNGSAVSGPAASVGAAGAGDPNKVDEALADLRAAFAGESAEKLQLIAKVDALAAKRNQAKVGAELVETLRALLDDPDSNLSGSDTAALFSAPTQPLTLYKNAMQAIAIPGAAGGAAGTPAAGLRSILGGIDDAFENLLNVTSYYQMKKRAGDVGAAGAATLIARLAALPSVKRIHLVGHSFGGRLVTAAAMATAPSQKLHSLTLLQAAFSHNAFSPASNAAGTGIPEGYFRRVITEGRISGPILITFSDHDHAVGKAYAIASRVSQQNAASVGGPNDPYGGIGANGAQRLESTKFSSAVTALAEHGSSYAWEKGKVHNLASHQFISGHGDVRGKQVAWAIASAIAS